MNGCADALVSPATADIAGHRLVDILVGRRGFIGKQGHGRHDLSRLAIAALGHLQLDPCLLHRVIAVSGQVFDGGDLPVAESAYRKHTGTHGFSVDMNGAGAALGDPATELGAGQSYLITERPQKRGIRFDVDFILTVVYVELDHVFSVARIRVYNRVPDNIIQNESILYWFFPGTDREGRMIRVQHTQSFRARQHCLCRGNGPPGDTDTTGATW